MPMGYTFVYDGVSSEIYNASLVFLDENYTNRPSGSQRELITTSITRNPRQLYLGVKYPDVLTFNIEVVFDNPVDIFTFSQFKEWLGGKINYAPLKVCAENFLNFYWNCIINLKEDLIYNGGYRGVSAEVQCDSPWAYQDEQTNEYLLSTTSDNNFIFENISADNEEMRPKITFHMAEEGDIKIRCVHYNESRFMIIDEENHILENNLTYAEAISYCKYNEISLNFIRMSISYDKTTKFTNLLSGDIISCDSDSGIITSKKENNIIDKFNKVFFKLPQGKNNITITGKADKIYITYENAIRFGGGYY